MEIVKEIQLGMERALQKPHEEALRFWLEKMVDALDERRDEVRVVKVITTHQLPHAKNTDECSL